jgi:trigger factor
MNVTETMSEGLKREYRVVVPATDLAAKVQERLVELKDKVQIKGFRPGKVPMSHLQRLYGRSAMAETIETTVRDTNARIFTERGFKLATDAKVTLPTEEKDVEQLIEGKSDLDYTVAIEIVPEIKLADFKSYKLTRLTTDVQDSEVDEGIERIAAQNKPYEARGEGQGAQKDDRVVMKFVGSIDGKPFEGGSGDDVPVVIGSNSFIPGFEDQLVGIKSGETRTVSVTFPEQYPNQELAGKDASFEVTAKLVEMPGKVEINDEFAKGLGLESLAKLRDAVKERIAAEHSAASRQLIKRALLDEVDKSHKFDPPPSLVSDEFERIWKSTNDELASQGRTFADENTTEEKAKAEYQEIANRRVRLGLVLAEIGEKNNITVTDEEVNRALVERIRQFPGQEQKVWEFYRNNQNALASLRAPIFEDKVIDFLLELADVTENKVSRDELYKQEENQDGPAS